MEGRTVHMDELRREHLLDNWNHETDDPETREWREELDFVGTLDDRYITGVAALCAAILVRERVRERFSPGELLELETIHDHCRVRLADGRLLLARLDKKGGLRLDEIDGAC